MASCADLEINRVGLLIEVIKEYFIGLWVSHHYGYEKTWAVTVCIHGNHCDTAEEHKTP